jgi:hypothetical protein
VPAGEGPRLHNAPRRRAHAPPLLCPSYPPTGQSSDATPAAPSPEQLRASACRPRAQHGLSRTRPARQQPRPTRPPRAPPSTLPCPKDCLLLAGSCIVEEAVLTGESTPQWKTAVNDAGVSPKERLDIKAHKHHVLFGGTKILQHTGDKAARLKCAAAGALAYANWGVGGFGSRNEEGNRTVAGVCLDVYATPAPPPLAERRCARCPCRSPGPPTAAASPSCCGVALRRARARWAPEPAAFSYWEASLALPTPWQTLHRQAKRRAR